MLTLFRATALLLASACIEVSEAVAELPTGLSPGKKIVCIGEQAIGFRWVNGDWKSTDFIPGRYIVEKLSEGTTGSGYCRDLADKAKVDVAAGSVVFYGCYTVRREAGELEGNSWEHLCRERWQKAGDHWVIIDVACENFRFRPDGWFHRTSLHGDLADKPDGDGKEPLSITVGHCRTL
jgi:hypothetical protein